MTIVYLPMGGLIDPKLALAFAYFLLIVQLTYMAEL